MRYFTRGWANGECDDAESERIGRAYFERLAAIEPRLSPAMRRLAREAVLHDAVIEDIHWRPVARELALTLATVTDAAGGSVYHTVTLTYVGALLGAERQETLRRLGDARDASVLYDEVDFDEEEGELVHRLLFSPCEELTIDFSELRLQIEPRADRRMALHRAFHEEIEPAAVWLLQHTDGANVRRIGVFSTPGQVDVARVILSGKPGFCDHPDGFIVEQIEIDRIERQSGFGSDAD